MRAALAALIAAGGILAAFRLDAQVSSAAVGSATFLVPAAPERGFHFPYLLKVPQPAGTTLLVLPNNTGMPSDDLDVHFSAALTTLERGPGALTGRRLSLVMLVPIFPRPSSQSDVYTHALDRDTMEMTDGELERLDLQLLAMVDDALSTLRSRGLEIEERVALVGFSASGTFVNRFAFLHPDRVAVAVSGGINGLPMLPRAELHGVALAYPLGVADIDTFTGKPFDFDAWSRIPQLIFMGALDTNDTLPFSDAFSDSEKAVIRAVIGERMQPDRWQACEAVYAAFHTRAVFKTYADLGHGTDAAANADIVEFVRASIEEARVE